MLARHSDILDLLRRDGRVSVDDLAGRFGVTLQTIRRDLSDLAEAGRVERVHGGAIAPSGTVNIAYQERRDLNAAAKAAIAQATAALIPNGSSLFLNIGTTTEAVAQALLAHQGLFVVTNNMNVAEILRGNDNAEVIVTGGTLRRSDAGLIGPIAAQAVTGFRVDLAVVGCSAVSSEGDLLDFDLAEVAVSRAMLSQARQSMLVADHSKFERKAPARIASIWEMGQVITDAALPFSRPASASTEIVVAGVGC